MPGASSRFERWSGPRSPLLSSTASLHPSHIHTLERSQTAHLCITALRVLKESFGCPVITRARLFRPKTCKARPTDDSLTVALLSARASAVATLGGPWTARGDVGRRGCSFWWFSGRPGPFAGRDSPGRRLGGRYVGRGVVARGRPQSATALLRWVVGLGGRCRRRPARRRLHQGGPRAGGCQAVPTPAACRPGWRGVESEWRGQSPARTAWPGTRPKRDDHEALSVCREARVAVLGQWMRVLGGASRARRPCLRRCGVLVRRRLSGGGGVGAHRSQPPKREGVPAASARTARW